MFTRGYNCKALTGKILAFWIGGRLWEVVVYEGFRAWRFDCTSFKSLIELLSSLLNENSNSSLEVVCSSSCLQMHIVWFNIYFSFFFIHFDVCEW